jgi:signal transduction histidine kinase
MRLFSDPDRARRLGLALAALSVAAVLVGFGLFVAGGGRLAASWMPHNLIGSLVLAVAFGTMVRQQPHNGAVWALGWSMVLQAWGQALVLGTLAYGISRELGREVVRDGLTYTFEELPTWLALLQSTADVTWIPAVVPLATFALLLFPDGRLPSRRWRPVAWLAAFGIVLTSAGFARADRPQPDVGAGTVALDGTAAVMAGVGGLCVATAIVLSIASLIVRYRRSSGIERRQIRWIAAGGAMFGASILVWVWAIVDLDVVERVFWSASLVTFPALLAAYAVAILRYRLYDIDLVISRSLVIAVLAGFIAVVYVTVVVGVGHLVGAGERPRLGLQVVATAIVAVAFQPLRMRARRLADRLVLGHRATPYEVLSAFSRQAANAGDDSTLQRVADLLAAGTGAVPATVWLRVGDELRPAAVSDGSDAPTSRDLRAGELPDLDVSLTVPVRHEGELLGAVTLTKPRSEPPTDQDEELATRLAGGLALVLRNARLTAELRDRLRDLEASRQRIVHAQDDARRKIERDLRAGAQQQLAELERLLEDARADTAEAGAERTAGLLEQLEAELDDAIATLRDLAQGIYPPLLESEGLGAALADRVQRSPLPVTLHASGLGRYGREIEGAVYFCVLEALQNAARYSDASSVHVRLDPRDDHLWFEVSDDGVGFDPAAATHGSGLRGMTDRLDTVGGELEIRSTPGVGTRISGSVPVPQQRATMTAATTTVEA